MISEDAANFPGSFDKVLRLKEVTSQNDKTRVVAHTQSCCTHRLCDIKYEWSVLASPEVPDLKGYGKRFSFGQL